MGRAIYKIGDDEYLCWSSVVDAPISYICTRKEMEEFLFEEEMERAKKEIAKGLEAADKHLTSSAFEGKFTSYDQALASMVRTYNVYHPDEKLNKKTFREMFTCKEGV